MLQSVTVPILVKLACSVTRRINVVSDSMDKIATYQDVGKVIYTSKLIAKEPEDKSCKKSAESMR